MDIQNELITFLEENNKHNYFYYIHRGNGALETRKEYILDMLLQYLLEAYIVFPLSSSYVFNSILEQDLNYQEKITTLKQCLFVKSKEIYDEVIQIVTFFKNSAFFTLNSYLLLEQIENPILDLEKIKLLIEYIQEEMKTFTERKEISRTRKVS